MNVATPGVLVHVRIGGKCIREFWYCSKASVGKDSGTLYSYSDAHLF